MSSPTYGHLVKRAVFQSAPPIYPSVLHQVLAGTPRKIANHTNCYLAKNEDDFYDNPQKSLECMKKIDPIKFIKTDSGTPLGLGFINFPSINDDFPFTPYEAIVNGSFGIENIESMIMGNNQDEATIFLNAIAPDYFTLDHGILVPENLTDLDKFSNFVTNVITDRVPQARSKALQISSGIKLLAGREPFEDEPLNFVNRIIKKATRLIAVCAAKITAEEFNRLNKTAFLYNFCQR